MIDFPEDHLQSGNVVKEENQFTIFYILAYKAKLFFEELFNKKSHPNFTFRWLFGFTDTVVEYFIDYNSLAE